MLSSFGNRKLTVCIFALLVAWIPPLGGASIAAGQASDVVEKVLSPIDDEGLSESSSSTETESLGLSKLPKRVDTEFRFGSESKPEPSAESGLLESGELDSAIRYPLSMTELKQDAYCPPIAAVQPGKTYPDVRVTGFFQLDTAYFGQSDASRTTLGDINDGMGFRRARLAATGGISERASYIMEFDFAQAQARFVDVWGQVADTALGKMRIGRFRQPFGMTDLTSIRELPFLERPTLFALGPFRQTGVMFFDTTEDKSKTYAVSGFRSLSDNFGNVYGESGGYGLSTRLTYLPINCGEGRVVHLGLDYCFQDPARNLIQYASTDEVFIGQQPGFGPSGLSVLPIEFTPAFLNTGVFTLDNVNLFNLEGAIGWGRTVIQSELRLAHVSTPGGSVDLPGAYVHVRHMLTGETIPYNFENGVFGRVKPLNPMDRCNGNFGAWEIAARLSYLDLNPVLDLPGTTGPARRLTSGTLGLNWYWWNNAKAQFNWIIGDLNDRTVGNSTAQTLAARLQFDF